MTERPAGYRPYAVPRRWTWTDGNGNRTHGIGLMHGQTCIAHLTPDEAIKLADRLVDMAERLTPKNNPKE